MKSVVDDAREEYQAKVTAQFQSQSSHWNDLYSSQSAYAETMRARSAAVLDWIDSLALAPGSQVLEIGCGAGLMAIALAERGLRVQAIDVSDAMVQQARENVAQAGRDCQINVEVGDVYDLTYADDFFDLVLAIGVFPWLAHAEPALREMARVTKPEGHVLLTTSNWIGLPALLDPRLNPSLAPLRRRVRAVLRRIGFQVGLPEQLPKLVYHRRRFIDGALGDVGMTKVRSKTLGFAPFTFLSHNVLPNRLALSVHHILQRLADQNVPVIRSTGIAYLVLARLST